MLVAKKWHTAALRHKHSNLETYRNWTSRNYQITFNPQLVPDPQKSLQFSEHQLTLFQQGLGCDPYRALEKLSHTNCSIHWMTFLELSNALWASVPLTPDQMHWDGLMAKAKWISHKSCIFIPCDVTEWSNPIKDHAMISVNKCHNFPHHERKESSKNKTKGPKFYVAQWVQILSVTATNQTSSHDNNSPVHINTYWPNEKYIYSAYRNDFCVDACGFIAWMH